MNVNPLGQWKLVVLLALILSEIGVMESSIVAASIQSKKERREIAALSTSATGSPNAAKVSRPQSVDQPPGRLGKSLLVEPVKKFGGQAVRQARRRLKGSQKHRSQVTVQAKPDISYHGILERPQRYDPRLDHRKGGSSNPQVDNVLHDHFQELDKNHDGAIDPIERAIGRIDLDRDL